MTRISRQSGKAPLRIALGAYLIGTVDAGLRLSEPFAPVGPLLGDVLNIYCRHAPRRINQTA